MDMPGCGHWSSGRQSGNERAAGPSGKYPQYRSFGSLLGEQLCSCLRCQSFPTQQPRAVAYKFVSQIACNGNLQIKMHCFTSQHLSQR